MAGRRKFEKVAVANRGEVAVRILRACQELGLETVLLHSSVDVQAVAYRLADEKVCIGEAASSASYLNIEANVQGALSREPMRFILALVFFLKTPTLLRPLKMRE